MHEDINDKDALKEVVLRASPSVQGIMWVCSPLTESNEKDTVGAQDKNIVFAMNLLRHKFCELSKVGGIFAGTTPKLIVGARHGELFSDDLLFSNNHHCTKYTRVKCGVVLRTALEADFEQVIFFFAFLEAISQSGPR